MKHPASLRGFALLTLTLSQLSAVHGDDQKPNIVFVLADDLGWAEPGCYGNNFNETPNLDRLAMEGMRFTQAYAAAPVCSPYRAALLTGQAPARVGITDYLRPNSANALSPDQATLPEILGRSGYATGMVGKWHLTGYRHHEAEFELRPTDHGFDWNIGSEVKGVGNGANTWPYVFRDQPHFIGGISGGAIRSGDWKLIEHFDTGKDELFSLADDLGEAKNLADEKPAVVRDLKQKLADWRDSVGARIPSPPILTESRKLYFGDHFKPGLVSERFWYTKDWVAEDGILKRLSTGTEDTRIFLRDAEYKDVVIQFDFRLGHAQDVRLITGSGGGYNAVIHLRPDHFFIQTASDRSVPYFSYRHGECAFDFDPDRWYTMTVEFLSDEVIAHLDSDHVAHAQHPIIDRTRQYFAFQVDENPAAFDNIQVFTASAKKRESATAARKHLASVVGKHPVQKTIEAQFEIQKTNAHEWFYQNDKTYRGLVNRIDELDQRNKQLFPEANRSHKEFTKYIAKERKKFHETDPIYRETLFATHRANRAIDAFLIEQKPEIDEWPRSRKEAEMERLRKRFEKDAGYLELVAAARAAQEKLESDYPQLFVSDEEINEKKKAAHERAKNDPVYRAAKDERAAAYRKQQDYLFANDKELAELDRQLKQDKP